MLVKECRGPEWKLSKVGGKSRRVERPRDLPVCERECALPLRARPPNRNSNAKQHSEGGGFCRAGWTLGLQRCVPGNQAPSTMATRRAQTPFGQAGCELPNSPASTLRQCSPLIPGLRRWIKAHLCEFEASLGYRMNPKQVRAT